VAKRAVRRSTKLSEERYFEELELALADGVLTSDESAALCSLALKLDVPLSDLNRRFVQSLAEGAKADGVVTPAEVEEVYRVARLLNIADAEVAAMIATAPANEVENTPRLTEGTPVCVVGGFEGPTMAQVVSAADRANLVIRKNITSSVGVVVVESRGQNLARENRAKALGIPVVTVAEFMRLVESPRAKA
jgi:DNA polymerase-3 subunit epsilon